MKKTLRYYLSLDYTIRIKQNQDGSFFAQVEELPGCITEADTQTEAFALIEDAKKTWIASA